MKLSVFMGFIRYLASDIKKRIQGAVSSLTDLALSILVLVASAVVVFVFMFGGIGILIWLNILKFDSELMNTVCRILSFAIVTQIVLMIRDKYKEYLRELKKVVEEI